MQFGMSRLPGSNGGMDTHASCASRAHGASPPKIRTAPPRPGPTRGVAAKVTEAWGKGEIK
ncbi:hypothetical protein COCSUDRAFT_33355 [Coccomyxa subellipsoidea C-169]|uniref:Uncharacterized protein n=1 Tax=Coccomyxa subellipsoidea (strain C-169) TaxID=574566 RepID=I0YW97_COCSC|nr:hypothetical protein COCSUDRAFT_33355 [Coccomyxa subellipsoidea C-169]EIE22666.1 hypothetical protein COCSUDRAFT_33355 [Coccomyxa subellipsoidea C-169]|eukprot:XP_005647210.1 hypothetical protein COCSUDRAFT_33355 [Coccomyxa subellipsoidea C-169]